MLSHLQPLITYFQLLLCPRVINLLLFLQLWNVLSAMTSLASSLYVPKRWGNPHLIWVTCGTVSQSLGLLLSTRTPWPCWSQPILHQLPLWSSELFPQTLLPPSLSRGNLLLSCQQYPSQAICLVILLRSSFSQIPTWAVLFCFFWS